MSKLSLLYHLIRADFLERVRRYSFLVTLVLALYLGYIYIPDASAGYVTVSLDKVRGVYNSAWVGAVFSLLSSLFLSVIGFYLVKNAVVRDYDTRVGQILASTPLSKFNYLLGKTLSNFAVLSAIVIVLLISAAAMQLIRGEDMHLNLWQLASPTLFMAMPFLLVVSAAAVLFEVTPLLRGALGNVVFFILWNLTLVTSMIAAEDQGAMIRQGYNDLPGTTWILAQMTEMASGVLADFKGNVNIGILLTSGSPTHAAFVWPGMEWTIGVVMQRLLWVGAALGIVAIATPIFQRFEVTSPKAARKKAKKEHAVDQQATAVPSPSQVRLTELSHSVKPLFVPMLRAELRLMFAAVGIWWYVVAAALVVATLLTPMEAARQFLYPASWIWPIALWSSMGTRERKYGTEQVVFASPGILTRQLPALWLAGIAVAAVTGCGMFIRLLLAGDMTGVAAWAVGVMFIPTFALAAGVWTGRPLMFEALYVALWYIGPMNQVPPLDFMGATPQTTMANTSVFVVVATGLSVAAVIGRRRQLSI